MDEMIIMYRDMPRVIRSVSDISAIKKADTVLTKIEDLHQELLDEAAKYIKCFNAGVSAEFTLGVIGADGHPIVHLLRNIFPRATISWFPNLEFYDKEYIGLIQGIILSQMAVNAVFSGDLDLGAWLGLLVDRGFVLFPCNEGLDRRSVNELLNAKNLTVFKFFSPDIVYAVYVQKTEPKYGGSEQYKKLNARFRKIYCVCPALVKSGGPELLHQLVCQINRLGGDADIAYINSEEAGGYTNPEFAEYVAGHVISVEDIEDEEGNAVVIPEGWPFVCKEIRKAKILFWWLSVDNFKILADNDEDIEKMIREVKESASIHLVQSEYARTYVKSLGIPDNKICHLSDYINEVYLENGTEADKVNRRNSVIYNPKKGKELVDELMRKAPDIDWIAIEKMNTEQVGELMRSSKVYIDFGNHPGKDRIPREAAINGCVILTGKKGSAAYSEDVTIPERYKLDETVVTCEKIIETIRKCLKDYDSIIDDYKEYREIIAGEKIRFIEDVESIFFSTDRKFVE